MTKILFFAALTGMLVCCNSSSKYSRAEDADEAGREFIRASLDGDYEKARFYLLDDSTETNIMLLNRWKQDYNRLSQEEKVNYKEASIIALKIEPVNDSTVNYVYTNSLEEKDTTTIKVVKVNNSWLVDLKDIH